MQPIEDIETEPPRMEGDVRTKRESSSTNQTENKLYNAPYPLFVVPKRLHGFFAYTATLSLLAFFSIWGVLIRLGLSALANFSGHSVFPLLWAQVVGCTIMGAVSSRRAEIERFYLPLYVGLTTGLCGSITTFSSWMLQTFQSFANTSHFQHNGFYNFLDGVNHLVTTLAACYGAFILGNHFADWVLSRSEEEHKLERSVSLGQWADGKESYNLLVTAAGLLFWIGAIILCALHPPWRPIVTFALVLGPLGTYTRFYLSALNTRSIHFPYGTFSANIFACAIEGVWVALQYSPAAASDRLACGFLQGLNDGLCGCTSTVSTFMAEVRNLKRKPVYRYVIISWVCGQAAFVVTFGAYYWATGSSRGKCSY